MTCSDGSFCLPAFVSFLLLFLCECSCVFIGSSASHISLDGWNNLSGTVFPQGFIRIYLFFLLYFDYVCVCVLANFVVQECTLCSRFPFPLFCSNGATNLNESHLLIKFETSVNSLLPLTLNLAALNPRPLKGLLLFSFVTLAQLDVRAFFIGHSHTNPFSETLELNTLQ